MNIPEKYTITVLRPTNMSVEEMKTHIRDAVSGWGGQYDPSDPRFNVEVVSIGRAHSSDLKTRKYS